MNCLFLIRYGEIGLKGLNRKYFVEKLVRNIKTALSEVSNTLVYSYHSRILVACPGSAQEIVLLKLKRIFGIVSISPVIRTATDLEAIQDKAWEMFENLYKQDMTFKIQTRRQTNSSL